MSSQILLQHLVSLIQVYLLHYYAVQRIKGRVSLSFLIHLNIVLNPLYALFFIITNVSSFGVFLCMLQDLYRSMQSQRLARHYSNGFQGPRPVALLPILMHIFLSMEISISLGYSAFCVYHNQSWINRTWGRSLPRNCYGFSTLRMA